MYIKNTRSWDESDGQHAARQDFLILTQPESWKGKGDYVMRAFVRKVALRQVGHWMMGKARIHGHSVCISGAYGHDGLPVTLPDEIHEKGLPVPDELRDAWNKGGGWNSCGSEAPLMRKWALENLSTLKS